MTRMQHEAVERLEGLLDYFLAMPSTTAGELGRAGEKLSNLLATFLRVPAPGFADADLASFLSICTKDFDRYSKSPGPSDPSVCPARAAKPSTSDPVGVQVSMGTGMAKPVVADRIKWKLGPSFDPVPYLSDRLVKQAFIDPEILRKPSDQWPRRPRAKVHCSVGELWKLAQKWDALGACRLTGLL